MKPMKILLLVRRVTLIYLSLAKYPKHHEVRKQHSKLYAYKF